eukprot:1328385-Amorphochlora_amoeboformis.AAC.1
MDVLTVKTWGALTVKTWGVGQDVGCLDSQCVGCLNSDQSEYVGCICPYKVKTWDVLTVNIYARIARNPGDYLAGSDG